MRFATAAACALILHCLSVLSGATLLVTGAVAPAAAQQQGDLGTALRRFNELYAAGNYPGALVEAQKVEAIAKVRFGINHVHYGAALNNLAMAYDAQGKYADAEELFKRALAIREKALGKEHPDVASILNNLAAVYDEQGKYADAEELHKRALAIREKALGKDHPDVARSLHNLAVVYQEEGKFADAEALDKRAVAINEKALGKEHPIVASSLNSLASIYTELGKYAEAESLHKRVLAIREKALGKDHPDTASSLHNLANVYTYQGKYADAEDLYKRALAIREKALGAGHPEAASTLHNLAIVYKDQGKYADAEAVLKRAAAIKEKSLGANHPDVADNLYTLATVYTAQGKYADAEELIKRALAIREKALGTDHPTVAAYLDGLAALYKTQARHADAEGLEKRALAIREKALGAGHPDVANALNNLAAVYEEQGKYADAEGLFKRALAIYEKALGKDHPDVASSLYNLAGLYQKQGKYADAEGVYKRALAIYQQANHSDVSNVLWGLASLDNKQGKHTDAEQIYRRVLAMKEQALGPNHPDTGGILRALASELIDQGKYAEVEEISRRALAIQEQSLGHNHPEVANDLSNLAVLYRIQERYADAAELHQRALAIREQALGPNHKDTADSLHSLAVMYAFQNKYAEAEAFYLRALAIYERALGENHPEIAHILHNLALMSARAGNVENALAYARKATAAVARHASAESPGVQDKLDNGLLEERAQYFLDHVAYLDAAVAKGMIQDQPAAAREAFEMAQWTNHSSAAAAVQQMGLRFASGNDALAALVRERQDLSALGSTRDAAMVAALARPEAQQDRAAITVLRQQLGEIDQKLTAIGARLEKEFPDYGALANPKPINPQELQRLLAKDEALVFFLSAERHWETYLFAVTQDGFEWKTIPLDGKVLAEKVALFRRGLDVDALHRGLGRVECTQAEAEKRGLSRTECAQAVAKECEEAAKRGLARTECAARELFDLGLSHELYEMLLGPVEPLIKDKKHLIVVPSGALTALPFHLLVTQKPAVAVPPVNAPRDLSAYRDAAWLIKRQAVSVLPSVASLKALRMFARKDAAKSPLVGFGDPVFNAEEENRPGAQDNRSVVATRSYTEFWQGVDIDRTMLGKALPRLPETAAELREVAKNLGAPESSIHLRADASESTVKRTALADYRVVYFATHGLVAGEIKGLAEPSLALTLPKQPSDMDDGLLTASEVAQLKLNADWVVLSACNTIAGDKPGAEALSGLARAFFYAGARALLVSHWAVESNAAMRLTTSTFDILKSDPKLGRAEALRRATLAYMNDTTNPLNAYPALWAPFVVVGEGAAR
jgi:tetratricopeptide (TPR) repeat protein